MPMLIPNAKTLSKSLQSISKNGLHIDDIVRNSIKCDLKKSTTLKKSCIHAHNAHSASFTIKTKSRLLLRENSLKSSVKTSPSKSLKNYQKRTLLKSSTQHLRKKNSSSPSKRYPLNDCPSKRYPLNDMNCCRNVKRENTDACARSLQDDSLTSLQWLTGMKVNDLLEGKPIQYSSPPSPSTSSSSDDNDEKSFLRRESRYYGLSSVDYRQNHEIKPPYSYAALIIMAMKSKGCGKMTLSEIYKWISDHFLFYRNAEPTWQNSIRHNLSLNKCFAKIPRKKGDPGKGGYWSIVPEFANKLLENSIRKRRSSIFDYETNDAAKRQRLDMLESQLLSKLKTEFKHGCSDDGENTMMKPGHLPVVPTSTTTTINHDQPSPVEMIADMEHCRMDHPYGKSPVVNYNVSDEENIRAIATHLEETTSNVGVCVEDSLHIPPNNTIFNTLSSAIRTDCIWSSEQHDHMAESMSHVTNELLEAQEIDTNDNGFLKTFNNSLNNSLNSSSGGLGAPSLFCLSPPISGDDDRYSDEIDDIDDRRDGVEYDDDEEFKYLRVRGTSVTLFEPTTEMMTSFTIKEEPLSPNSVDE